MIELTERERLLITYGLLELEGQCYGGELHYDTEDALGGTPDGEEVRAVMDKVKEKYADDKTTKPSGPEVSPSV